MKLSLTTVALPDLDLHEIVGLSSALGYDGIELRVRRVAESARGQPYSFWGAHRADVTPDNFVAEAPNIAALCADHGLAVCALASNETALEIDDVARLSEGAAICGCPLVRIGAPRRYDGQVSYHDLFAEAVDAFGRALQITSEHGVRGLLEIHGGTIAISATMAYRLVSQFTPQQIGVVYDTQNMVREGFEGYRLGLDVLGPYLAHVHIGGHRPAPGGRRPDGTTEWTWQRCAIADGLLDPAAMIAELGRVGYAGFMSVEDFREMDAKAKFAEAAVYLRHLMDSEAH